METTNWETAKQRPGDNDGRQDFHGRFQPLMVTDQPEGHDQGKKGSCRPTIVLMCIMSRPVTPAATTMGMPMAPKATGAVLAMRQTPAA